ncbi:MAG: hypothetical protein JSS02_35620 [Planctomycetes bacterium]|nr:hypothetical protein [Planctomycetota bacterium]
MDQRPRSMGQDVFEVTLGVSVIFVAPYFLSGGTVQELAGPLLFAGVCAAPFVGIWLIRWVVRRVNQLDDPRCQKPPADPP